MEVLADPSATPGLAHSRSPCQTGHASGTPRLVRELTEFAANAIVGRHGVHASKDSRRQFEIGQQPALAKRTIVLPLANEYVRFSRSAISAATPVNSKCLNSTAISFGNGSKNITPNSTSINLSLDISRMNFTEEFIEEMRPRLTKAFRAMAELEMTLLQTRMKTEWSATIGFVIPAESNGNQDRHRPNLADIKAFTAKVHAGEITGADGNFEHFLIIGIGGSALGHVCFQSTGTAGQTDDTVVYRQH